MLAKDAVSSKAVERGCPVRVHRGRWGEMGGVTATVRGAASYKLHCTCNTHTWMNDIIVVGRSHVVDLPHLAGTEALSNFCCGNMQCPSYSCISCLGTAKHSQSTSMACVDVGVKAHPVFILRMSGCAK